MIISFSWKVLRTFFDEVFSGGLLGEYNTWGSRRSWRGSWKNFKKIKNKKNEETSFNSLRTLLVQTFYEKKTLVKHLEEYLGFLKKLLELFPKYE